MPYRRRRAMGYGRRRRYARRRPATGRSVPRTTLAPRHQYLKLRAAVNMVYAGTGTEGIRFGIPLDLMKGVVFTPLPATVANTSDVAPLGHTEYGNIFAKYVVHGVKFNLRFLLELSGTAGGTNTYNFGVCFSTTPDGQYKNGTPASLAAFPLGSLVTVTRARPYFMKRYISTSKVAGRNTSAYSEFIHLWEDSAVPTDDQHVNPKLVCTVRSGNIALNDSVQIIGTVTYYVSAVAVKEDISALQTVAVNALTDPGVPFGEPDRADALDHDVALNTGVAQHKRTLSELNLGGRR